MAAGRYGTQGSEKVIHGYVPFQWNNTNQTSERSERREPLALWIALLPDQGK